MRPIHRLLPLVFLLAPVCPAGLACPQEQASGNSYRFRVLAPIPMAVRALIERRFDCLCSPRATTGDLEVIVWPDEVEAFRRLVPGAVLIERGRPYREVEESALLAPDEGYFTVAEIVQEIDALAAQYPSLASRRDVSGLPGGQRTHGNRSIMALKISDNAASEEAEPAIVIAAQHHARELNSTYVVIAAMRRLLHGYASDPALRRLVDEHELWLVPCVNPDGTEHVWTVDQNWRKNRRDNGNGTFGVDNNRNYPFLWAAACGGSTSPGSATYRGPAAGSEPENQTMMALNRALRPQLYIDLHSFGREVLYTYSSCARVSAPIDGLLDRYVSDLSTPMTYGIRLPSASAEAPEWGWSASGTLSFLIEMSDQFQPPFAATIAEEARIWPGLSRALTTWRPALRGRVVSIYQQQPVEARLSYGSGVFLEGEQIVSRARDGRYQAWLPLGAHVVTFSAPGFKAASRTVDVTQYDQPRELEVCLEPDWQDATLVKIGTDRIGTITTLRYASPGDAGDTYFVGLSSGTSPGIESCGRVIPLNPDGLFGACLGGGSPLLDNIGVLAGVPVDVTFPIPPLPFLVGIQLFSGGITLAPGYPLGVKKFSAAVAIRFQP
jgi:hypothetical protein